MKNIEPINQTKLFGLNKYMKELIQLNSDNVLPNKILLSGQKGLGKCTLAYHFINYILSKNEKYEYDINNFEINSENHSFIITKNRSNPNVNIIDVDSDKKSININQIRELIVLLNKSSFNNKPRFILIDNIEFLNNNSVNALLKIIEEPSYNIFFILINNNKTILPTLKSRCLDFKITLSNDEVTNITNKILDKNFYEIINKELIDYYFTPGKIYNLIKFSNDYSEDLKNIKLNEFLSLIIDKAYYKKETSIKYMIFDFFELYISKRNNLKNSEFYNFFIKQVEKIKKFNLDEESLFIEFKHKLLNE